MAQILVVDDDAPIRDVLTEILQDEGYSVATASNGKEALNKLHGEEDLPRLILLDLNIAGYDWMGVPGASAAGLYPYHHSRRDPLRKQLPATAACHRRQMPCQAHRL